MAAIASALISGGTGILSGILGGNSAKNAAGTIAHGNDSAMQGVLDATGNAQHGIAGALEQNSTNVNNAGQVINDATGTANDTLQALLNGVNGGIAPGIASGAQGNTSLQQYAASNPQFDFDPSKFINSDAYNFQLKSGQDAIQNTAAAHGLAEGGGTLAALTQYGQGLASTYYNQAEDQARQQFQTNQDTTLANLQALINSGNTANSQQIVANQAFGAPQAQNTINAATDNATLQQFLAGQNLQGTTTSGELGLQGAKEAGDYFVNGANATASGQLGNTAALLNAVGAGANTLKSPAILGALGLA